VTSAIPGFNGEVYLSADGGTSYQKIGELTDVSLKVNDALIDATSFDSGGWEESIDGLKNWSATAGYFYIDGNAAQENAFNALVAGNTMLYRFYPKNQSGKNKWEGTGRFQDWSLTQNKNSAVAVQLSIKGTGALTKGDQ
jgi:predicted secreted protein